MTSTDETRAVNDEPLTDSTDETANPIEILLVEPNPGDTRLFTEKFKDAKLLNTINSVTDADAALDFVHQRGDYTDVSRPDIVLLDPELPGKSGMDVLSELKNEPVLSEIPVVVLTSSTAGEAIVKSRGLEADTYLQKPVEPDEFVNFVQSIEEFWLAIVRETPEE